MMDENNEKKIMGFFDPKRTGAIPRDYTNQNQQFLPSNYWDVVEIINKGLRVCVILRGLPGSGKSYLGRKLIDDTINKNHTEHIISADDYFIINGRYQYDPSKIGEAHDNCKRLFFQRASKGYSPLIVDNTNLKCWEMLQYIRAAIEYEYHLEIMEPNTSWKFNAGRLAQKNKHNVSLDKIKKMMDNYDKVLSVRELAKNQLNVDIVKEPKIRNIPPYKSNKTALLKVNSDTDLANFSLLDINRNNQDQREPLSWQKFNSEFQKQNVSNATASSYFSWDVQKKNHEETQLNSWNPPPQIFEDKWDQPDEKEITIKEKDSNKNEIKPQPQRRQRKNKKPSSPSSSDSDLKPHRKNCPNESPNFAQLRELYPNVCTVLLWDFFEKCKFDAEWCADMLCDENLPEQMDFAQDLTCNCFNFNSNSNNNIINISSNNADHEIVKKQTPVKAKKVKPNSDEQLAAKIAIEENIKIGEDFYPEHVNKVKSWKNLSQTVAQPNNEVDLMDINMLAPAQEDETLVALSIDDSLIKELDDLYGEDNVFMRDVLQQQMVSKTKFFIKSSTAKQLYREILETFYSHQEEEKLKEIENDRYLAMMLHEEEKAIKYPKLAQTSNGNFKDIMDTQAALKEYQNDMSEWQKVEKPETMADKLSKEKLYKVFPFLDNIIIDELFEAQNKNFKNTIQIIQDSLGYSGAQRKQVAIEIANSVKFNKDPSSSEVIEEDEFTPEEYACIKNVEELQEEIDRHSEEIMRCIQKSREHLSKKEFHASSYYTGIVNLHKQFYEQKRQQLVNMLAFSFLNNSSSTRLDLHYFTKNEASPRLHTFLDAHIAKLREIKKQFIELEIVTGRGAHSIRGPVLKNMTIKLFQERNLRYTEVNPGLLKVKVYPNSILYEEKQRLLKNEN